MLIIKAFLRGLKKKKPKYSRRISLPFPNAVSILMSPCRVRNQYMDVSYKTNDLFSMSLWYFYYGSSWICLFLNYAEDKYNGPSNSELCWREGGGKPTTARWSCCNGFHRRILFLSFLGDKASELTTPDLIQLPLWQKLWWETKAKSI